MASLSQLFGEEKSSSFDCQIRGAARTPFADVELHDYQFHGPQQAEFVPEHGFLDLALSRRPGQPRGRYLDAPISAAGAMGDVIFIPAGARLRSEWGGGPQSSICLSFEGSSDIDRPGWTAAELAASLDVMLVGARVPIKQISWHCGFETAAAFSAAFRRATGYRPREYRRLLSS